MPDAPLAYLISFRTYGTWLHGDRRGSTDRANNTFGRPRLPADEVLHAKRFAALREFPMVLDVSGRAIVETTLREVCTHRGWPLFAANARTNHVHAVVETAGLPERALVDFKAWCTRRLVENGVVAQGSRVWSRHGSTCYLWCAEAVEAACHYVLYEQDAPSLS